MTAKVTVRQPFQVTHDGVDHRPGDTVEVPEHVAREWVTFGWAKPAPEPKAAQRKSSARRR